MIGAWQDPKETRASKYPNLGESRYIITRQREEKIKAVWKEAQDETTNSKLANKEE